MSEQMMADAEYLRGEVAKAQYQLDHADALEIPAVGRAAYRDFVRRYEDAAHVSTGWCDVCGEEVGDEVPHACMTDMGVWS